MSRFAAGTVALLALVVFGRAADPVLDTVPALPASAAKLANADDARKKLGLHPHYAVTPPRIGDVKIAVLDSGFEGVDGKRPYLPKSAVVVEHYAADFVQKFGLGDPGFTKPFAPGYVHGRLMAQIAWATTGGSPHGPQFYLLNANGPTMFRRAVRMAIELKADIILFSGTFEGAGNYDGRGPINAAVDEAVAAGIIWVNAAGNTGGMVYNGAVVVGPDGYLKLKGGPDPTALRFTNRLDENAVTITLTWNDYKDAEDAGTDKDLDLFVEDWQGTVLAASKLRQVPAGKPTAEGETKNPRERVVIGDLPANAAGKDYRIRVKANSANFGPLDRVRIMISAAKSAPMMNPETNTTFLPVEFIDGNAGTEVYPPADHAGVLTVGDPTPVSAVGPTADGRVKPDVVISNSVARFSNGEETTGSSNAAAYFAGAVAVLRATEPGLTTAHLREWVRRLDERQSKTIPLVPPPAPLPSTFPPGLPRPAPPPARPAPPPAVSPNQQRALKFAEAALDERRKRGEADPSLWMSTPGGTFEVRRGGVVDPPAGVVPASAAQPAPRPAPPPSPRPAPPPDTITTRKPPHAAWLTPTPKELAELVRGK